MLETNFLSKALSVSVILLLLLSAPAVQAFVPSRTSRNPIPVSALASTTSTTTNNLNAALAQNRVKIVDTLQVPLTEEIIHPSQENNGAHAHLWHYFSEVNHMSWMSVMEAQTNDWTCASLACWNGPLIDVPHLMVRVQQSSATGIWDVLVNFCPRKHGAWDDSLPDGTFAEPNSSKAFLEREVRMMQTEKFYTAELKEWARRYENLPDVKPNQRAVPWDCTGPVRLELSLPEAQGAAAVQIMNEAVDHYLRWRQASERLGQVKAMFNYAFDIKTRPAIGDMVSDDLFQRMGSINADLAELIGEQDEGPPDQADRTTSMTNAALTNFEIDQAVEATQKD
jgi:hypothetical protein